METNLVKPYAYAELCEVTPQAIYLRIKTGIIEATIVNGPDGSPQTYIDINRYPPERLRKKSEK